MQALNAVHATYCTRTAFNTLLASLMHQFKGALNGVDRVVCLEERRYDLVTYVSDNVEDIAVDFFTRLLRLKGYRAVSTDVLRASLSEPDCKIAYIVVCVSLRELYM